MWLEAEFWMLILISSIYFRDLLYFTVENVLLGANKVVGALWWTNSVMATVFK